MNKEEMVWITAVIVVILSLLFVKKYGFIYVMRS